MLGVVGIDTNQSYITAEEAVRERGDYKFLWSGLDKDELHYDDFTFYQGLVRSCVSVTLSGIRVMWKGCVFGTQVFYCVERSRNGDKETVAAPGHFFQQGFYARSGRSVLAGRFDQTFWFSESERLENLIVRQGQVLNSVILVTNKRSYKCGDVTPNTDEREEYMTLEKPARNFECIGLAGSAHGVLKRIGVWYKSRWTCSKHIILLRSLVEENRAVPRANANADIVSKVISTAPIAVLHRVITFMC